MDLGAGKLFIRHNGGDWVDITDCTEFSVDYEAGVLVAVDVRMASSFEVKFPAVQKARPKKVAQWKQDPRFRFGGSR